MSRATEFAADFEVPHIHGSYEALAADTAVDAVYIGTPHAFHHEHTMLCLDVGKHVLCEKPLAVNARQAGQMVDAARTKGLALMEAVWTRFLPTLVRVRELIDASAIGEVRMINADFGFRADFDPASRLFAPELGGGALLDLGVYPLNLAVMLCGEPVGIESTANLGDTGIDEEAAMILRHAGGGISTLSCSLRVDTPREAHILGTEGRIRICHPWWASTRIILQIRHGGDEVMDLPSRGGGYAHEAEEFMDMIRTGRLESEIMPLRDSLAVMGIMDTMRADWGLRYPME
jgi:predicted dehydrogenase